MKPRVLQLPGGVRVAALPMRGVRSVALGMWIGVGGRHEPAPLAGAGHFIEHLLFKGTRRHSARQIAEAVEGRGGYLDGFTQEELTCYWVKVPDTGWEQSLELLLELYMEPRLAAADVRKERGVILEEIRMCRDDPEHEADERLAGLMWRGHALGRPLTGSPSVLRAMTRATLLDYWTRNYVAAGTLFVAAGRFDPDRFAVAVARGAARARRGAAPGFAPVDNRVRQSVFCFAVRPAEQAYLAMGTRVFGRHDPRRHALRLLSVILGENMSSRLFQAVRERHGLAYSVQSSMHLFADTGGLTITAGMDPLRLGRGVRLIARELGRLTRDCPGPGELARARDYAVGQIRLGTESATNRMMWAGESIMAFGRWISPEESIAGLSRVTPEHVRAVARDIFLPGRTSLAVVSPRMSAGTRAEMLDAVATVAS